MSGGSGRRRVLGFGAAAAAGATATRLLVRPGAAGAVAVAAQGVAVLVDARAPGRPISPLIYGVAHAGAEGLAATGARLHRWGGNPNTRFNWELGSAWNAARDWEFRNYGAGGAEAPESAPSGAVDAYVRLNRQAGVASYLTVPALGWVARDGDPETRSRGVPPAGGSPDGRTAGGIRGYDPAANRRTTSLRSLPRKGAPFADPPDLADGTVYQDEWVAHLVARFGRAADGGVGYYAVDNEPDLWGETHTDVHPVRPDYDALLSTFLESATAIKDVDPTAQVAGPALSGWQALFHSPRDREAMSTPLARAARRWLPGGLAALGEPDRRAHGGEPFLPWWLDAVRRHDARRGGRTLDVLDVHFYPQASGVYSDRADAATSDLRLRSTRALWDPTYADESWIGEPVRLIPRLREWIDRHYPGVRLAIGEWNWGAAGTLNGALAIADVLGVLGREGVDLAAYWTFPPPGSPGAAAFRLFTDADGAGGAFGDVSLPAESSDPAAVAAYASRHGADGGVDIVALNRTAAAAGVTFRVRGLEGAAGGEDGPVVGLYRLGREAPETLRDLGQRRLRGGEVTLELPGASATVLRIGGGLATASQPPADGARPALAQT
jgi:hypothetical protein